MIIGDSHVVALLNGFGRINAAEREKYGKIAIGMLQYGAKFLDRFHEVNGDHIVFLGDEAKLAFAKLSAEPIRRNDPRRFIISLGFHCIALYNYKCWEAHTVSASQPNKSYVSRAALREMVTSLNKHVLAFLEDLKSMEVNFSVMSSCPLPKTYLDGTFHPHFEEQEILDLDSECRNIFSKELTARGIEFNLPPSNTVKDGFLMDNLCAKRQVGDFHANAEYGEIFIRQLLQAS